jgi:hypothetical protein
MSSMKALVVPAVAVLSAVLAVVACSTQVPPSQSESASPIAVASRVVPTQAEATTSPTEWSGIFSFDVENRSHLPVIVSVTSDTAAVLPGFEPGQRGTVSIPLLNPQNGIGIELQGVGCRLLAKGFYPTPLPFTLLVEDTAGSGKVTLSTVAGAASSPLPLPSNSLVGCGG